ncbi:hypothetical protein PV325_009227 [Microctonus aethiopoides]|nr:hypothetical protein PV325_009227 [Microctonus aethiopoides]
MQRKPMSNSDEHDVTLLNVSRELSGIYKCEVSEDMPTYHTAMKEQRMDIADVPEFDPIIEVEKQRIAADEILKANCTSGASYPATNVTWILNGDPPDPLDPSLEKLKTSQRVQ